MSLLRSGLPKRAFNFAYVRSRDHAPHPRTTKAATTVAHATAPSVTTDALRRLGCAWA